MVGEELGEELIYRIKKCSDVLLGVALFLRIEKFMFNYIVSAMTLLLTA